MKKTAYKYLMQYKSAGIILRQNEQELAELRALAEYRGQSDGERVQTSVVGDALAVYVARIMEMEQQLADERRKLLLLRSEIVYAIQALQDSRYCDLLYRRYIELKSLQKIAIEMQYSPEYIRNHLHPAALQAMGEFLHNENMVHNVAF